MFLATASEEIRLWNFRGYDNIDKNASLKLVHHFNPHHEEISKIVWSSDNSMIGSTCKSGKSIYLTSLVDDEVTSVKLDASIHSEPDFDPETCLCFNSSNRFLLTGSLSGKIAIYDIKKTSMKRNYTPLAASNTAKQCTTCVTFTPDDHCSVSGHQGGEIIFINIRSNQIYSPMYLSVPNATTVAGNGGCIQALRFSRFNRTMLASAHSYGTVALWNTAHRVVSNVMDIHHRGPCMDISFSPVNEMLLVSAGLDRTIRCYDVLQAKHVQFVETEYPLFCVSVARDGYSLAAGTSKGKVLLYDLRSIEKPFSILNAHTGPVSELKFDNEPYLPVKGTNSDAGSVVSVDSVHRCSVESISRKPLVEATNVDPPQNVSQRSIGDGKLIEDVSIYESEADSTNLCEPIFPVNSMNTFNSTGCDNFSDFLDGRSSKLQKSVHFDDINTSPRPASASVHISDKFLDIQPSMHNSSSICESTQKSESVAKPENIPVANEDMLKLTSELRRDMNMLRGEIDQKFFEWYGKMVWQLCLTENRIISHVNKLLDDRKSLSEEVNTLRKENERLKKAF